MPKLSAPQAKALRYMLFVEMYGGVSRETWIEFDRYSPRGNTLDSLVKRGFLSELVTDEYGFVTEGGQHKITKEGYYLLVSEEVVTDPRHTKFATDRAKVLSATPIEEVPGTVIHESIEALTTGDGSQWTAEEIEKFRAVASADAKEIPGHDDRAPISDEEVLAVTLASRILGLSPAQVIANSADASKAILDLAAANVSAFFGRPEGTPKNLPKLPSPRCGYVVYEEIQCTKGTPCTDGEHEYKPADFMAALPISEVRVNEWIGTGEEGFAAIVDAIRETRNAYLDSVDEQMIALAHGDTTGPDVTERARLFRDLARDVCTMNGLNPGDVVHAHDAGRAGVAICTRFPNGHFVARLAHAIGERIAIETREDWRADVVSQMEGGSVGFAIVPSDAVRN